ncbi:class I SAM-dependent methyltransferase [Rhodobacteraceae bacterium CCMM004]|nr:class I SAM-dependent methyltransferase [Rhodobacteraceae bacterium CCMM004]
MTVTFWDIHDGLPREGPGEPADIAWALEVAGTPAEARILDAGCGPGADLETLAALRPAATLTGIEAHAPFAAAAQARLGDRATVHTGDMADPGGPYHLIWCAGALYFLGVTEGLTAWRGALAPGGHVAFSEPIWVSADPPEAARAFWAQYPAITDRDGLDARIAAAGYRVLGRRLLSPAGWEAYFGPLEARLDTLRAAGHGDASAVAEEAREIALWRQAPEAITYALTVVAPA